MSDERIPVWIGGLDRRSDIEAVVVDVLGELASQMLSHHPGYAGGMEKAVERMRANRTRDIPETIPAEPLTLDMDAGMGTVMFPRPDTIPAEPVRTYPDGRPEDCGERPGCRACGLGCGEEEDEPEEGDNGWSPSPPFTEPVIVSRCANPNTIPAGAVRELDMGLHAWMKMAFERGWFTQDSIQAWNQRVSGKWTNIDALLFPRKSCESVPGSSISAVDSAPHAGSGESELRRAAEIVVATLHCGEAATTRYKQEEHMDLKDACRHLAAALEPDSTGG